MCKPEFTDLFGKYRTLTGIRGKIARVKEYCMSSTIISNMLITCIDWSVSSLIEELYPLLVLRAGAVPVVHHRCPLQEDVGDVLTRLTQQDLWLESLV